MEDRKFEIIKQLMSELESMMQHSPEDLGGRLGREPAMEVEIESDEPMEGEEFAMEGDMEGPEEQLKQRLMKIRG